MYHSHSVPHQIHTYCRLDSKQVRNTNRRDTQFLTFTSSAVGELPPPPPRIFFGRDELVEKIVRLAENLTPTALIGAGGIGKTSVILTVLHDHRIKQRFGDSRWFIRCDQFPASRTHFLRRLSKVIGAGVGNPEDLAPLRPYLSSKEIIIILDNAESVLDPRGPGAREIYAIVDELIRFGNICLCITSRISTIPPDCETIEVPNLSMDAGHETFYRIFKHDKQSDPIDRILEQLDFHPLSITLLGTVAQHNKWDANRLAREWKRRRTGVLHTQHSGSLATTIELSLASQTFRDLGPDARGLLEVIAFFPQGVDEENVDWLFPTTSDGPDILDKFCILSLTYRSNGFVTMLAPLRDYLRPKDPTSSLLLGTTKEYYFTRLSARICPGESGFEESRWITSEDVNVEHLIDIFTSIDANSKSIWDLCAKFMGHLYWHKPRLVMLGPKIEALPDDHPSKARCLQDLSWLFKSVGNQVERKRLLTNTLKLRRGQGDDLQVARTLNYLSDTNRLMGHFEEGIQQAEEAEKIFERLGSREKRAECLISLAGLLHRDEQLDAAEKAASRAIDLLPEKGRQLGVCQGHRVLALIYHSKGNMEKAIHHFEVVLAIASSFRWYDELFWVHFSLAGVFCGEGRFDVEHAQLERAKFYAVNDPYRLARVSRAQAWLLYRQHRFEEAKSEASRALDMFVGFAAAGDVETTRQILAQINRDAQGKGLGFGYTSW